MGNNLFGANISGKIAKSFGPKLPKGILRKSTQGTRTAGNLAAGREGTPTDHEFRGIQIGLTGLRKDTILPDTKDAVLLLADTIKPKAKPVTGDRVIVNSITFTVVNVAKDPDEATFTCQVK